MWDGLITEIQPTASFPSSPRDRGERRRCKRREEGAEEARPRGMEGSHVRLLVMPRLEAHRLVRVVDLGAVLNRNRSRTAPAEASAFTVRNCR